MYFLVLTICFIQFNLSFISLSTKKKLQNKPRICMSSSWCGFGNLLSIAAPRKSSSPKLYAWTVIEYNSFCVTYFSSSQTRKETHLSECDGWLVWSRRLDVHYAWTPQAPEWSLCCCMDYISLHSVPFFVNFFLNQLVAFCSFFVYILLSMDRHVLASLGTPYALLMSLHPCRGVHEMAQRNCTQSAWTNFPKMNINL